MSSNNKKKLKNTKSEPEESKNIDVIKGKNPNINQKQDIKKTSNKHSSIFNFFKRKKENSSLDKKPYAKVDGASDKITKFSFIDLFRKKKSDDVKEVKDFKKSLKKKGKKKVTVQERRHKFEGYIERAGLSISLESLSKRIFNISVFINLILSTILIYHFSTNYGITWTTILISITVLWTLVFSVLLWLLFVFFYFIADLKIFKRNLDIEDVLPDYLQLTSSNIKSGMTIDRALWHAVRPRFGVLAKEIETVAKETMRGEDLKTALKKFSDKYESMLLKRSMSLLIEGLEAGGEIGNLLNKIALNIQENKIMKKEMSANVTTYVIFISFATIAAAPVLFALSGVLIKVISNLGSSLGDISSSGFALSFSGGSITYNDFRIFAIATLTMSSFFAAIIISTIKKGNAVSGLRNIPMFILVAITIFFFADLILGKMIGFVI